MLNPCHFDGGIAPPKHHQSSQIQIRITSRTHLRSHIFNCQRRYVVAHAQWCKTIRRCYVPFAESWKNVRIVFKISHCQLYFRFANSKTDVNMKLSVRMTLHRVTYFYLVGAAHNKTTEKFNTSTTAVLDVQQMSPYVVVCDKVADVSSSIRQ